MVVRLCTLRKISNIQCFFVCGQRYILDKPYKAMFNDGDYLDPFDPWFSEKSFNFNTTQRYGSALLYIGPVNSGTQFHAHSAAWNALIYGEKRWVRPSHAEGSTGLLGDGVATRLLPNLIFFTMPLLCSSSWNHSPSELPFQT